MVESRIELAILESNLAFGNSGIPGRFRLAHAFLINDINFDETAYTFDFLLGKVKYASDGFFDEIHQKRTEHGGDVVSFWVDNGTSCGRGYVGTPVSASSAFSVVNWVCATGYYSFAHEIMHNMGARHDRVTMKCPESNPCCNSVCHSFGWQDPGNRFRSIMAYSCPAPYNGCPRVLMVSQPSYPYRLNNAAKTEVPIGNVHNDNARQVKEAWNIVAGYYYSRIDCGNAICEPHLGEDCITCPEDCDKGVSTGNSCGNRICEKGENCISCPEDCSGRLTMASEDLKYCCEGGPENELSVKYAQECSNSYCRWNVDCSSAASTEPELRFCNGNGICENGETVTKSPDCVCLDDGFCDAHFEDETCADCSTIFLRCLPVGQSCDAISPDPCCNGCDKSTGICS